MILKIILNYLGKMLLGIYISIAISPLVGTILMFGTIPKEKINLNTIIGILTFGIFISGLGLLFIKYKERFVNDYFKYKFHNYFYTRILQITKEETVKVLLFLGYFALITGIILFLFSFVYYLYIIYGNRI